MIYMGDSRGAYRVLVGKCKGKSRRPQHRWEDYIKMDFKEIGWGLGFKTSSSGQEQEVGCRECSNGPSGRNLKVHATYFMTS